MSNNQINGVSSNKKYNEGKQKMGEQKRYHRNEQPYIAQQIIGEDSGNSPQKKGKNKVKDDITLIQKSMKNQSKQQYFEYQ